MAAYSARRCGAAYTVTNSSYNCEQRYFHIVYLYTHNEEGKKMNLDNMDAHHVRATQGASSRWRQKNESSLYWLSQ